MIKDIDYMIKCVDDKCTLVSLVDTNYNGIAENFICEGTYEYCKEKEQQMRALDELAKQAQEMGLYD